MKNIINRHGKRSLLALFALAVVVLPGLSRAEWVVQPKHFGGSIDLGQVKEGYSDVPLEDFSITRTGVYLNLSAVRDEKLELRLTIGGLYWFAANTGAGAEYRLIKFGNGLGEAQGIYSFGEPGKPAHVVLKADGTPP